MRTSEEVRQGFLDYFRSRGHLVVPSSSLIPMGDPTLLLTTAGMVQFKPYFLGQASPPARRLTSSQQCFRPTDLDSVGDYKHHTFFEMLGNFSIGDYFKREAIAFAWEFVTGLMGLPRERLWVTIYTEDEEAFRFWQEVAGVPLERIYRYGKKDNWWGPPGAEGPCGPCSEIHYDFGAGLGCGPMASPQAIAQWGGQGEQPGCHPNCERCERFVELWNLVFMQFYQDVQRDFSPLPAPNIDTGMGLERAAAILQGKRTVYETDLFQPLLAHIGEMAGKRYGEDPTVDFALRVIAEHGRGAAFLIADGVVPGNEGRGYVLRRIIRRAVRFGRKVGLEGPFLGRVAEGVIGQMGGVYPELAQNRGFILRVLELEEERFSEVFDSGRRILEATIRDLEAQALQPELEKAPLQGAEPGTLAILTELPAQTLPGSLVFTLYDTYGFPPELTEEIAKERGLSVDMEGFQKEMEAQKERARAGAKFAAGPGKTPAYERLGVGATRFLGYQELTAPSMVVGLLLGGEPVSRAQQGQEVELVLRETPFYAEAGGQVGDQGEIAGPSGLVVVYDTQAPVSDLMVHRGRVVQGAIALGETVEARVDPVRRHDIARHHTATHLLHAALRQVLGPHVRQSGSLVAPDRLRFDFTHIQALSPEELLAVEQLVNEKALQNLPVLKRETTFTQAVQEGALAFFGDKYGEKVRVVEVGDGGRFSFEVCGGTHLDRTGDLGFCLITSEQGIGAGLRRIEAVAGRFAEALARQHLNTLQTLAQTFETTPEELANRVSALLAELERERKRAAALERELLRQELEHTPGALRRLDGLQLFTLRVQQASSVDLLREGADWLKARLGTGALIVLGAVIHNRPVLLVALTPDLVQKGLDAGHLARELGGIIGGSGGGRADLAQAGGRWADKLEDALRQVSTLVRRQGL